MAEPIKLTRTRRWALTRLARVGERGISAAMLAGSHSGNVVESLLALGLVSIDHDATPARVRITDAGRDALAGARASRYARHREGA